MHDQWTSPELDSLLGSRSLTRRQVLVTSLATGFAVAVQPVAAATITTAGRWPRGRRGRRSRSPTARSRPIAPCRPRAGISRSCWWCRRSSACTSTSRTSAAASPSTATWRSRPSCTRARATRRSSATGSRSSPRSSRKVPDAQVMSDLDAAVAWAGKSGKGDTGQGRRHRLLLGRPHHLAVRGAQPQPEGRRRLVRAPARRDDRTAAEVPDRRRRRHRARRCSACTAARTRASRSRTSRRCAPRSRQPARTSEIVVFPEAGARVLRRLSSELPGRGRSRRLGAGAWPGSAPTASAEAALEPPQHADVGHQRQPVAQLALERRRAAARVVRQVRAARVASVGQVGDVRVQQQRAVRQRPFVAQSCVDGGVVGVAVGVAGAEDDVALRVERDRRDRPAGVVLRRQRRLPRTLTTTTRRRSACASGPSCAARRRPRPGRAPATRRNRTSRSSRRPAAGSAAARRLRRVRTMARRPPGPSAAPAPATADRRDSRSVCAGRRSPCARASSRSEYVRVEVVLEPEDRVVGALRRRELRHAVLDRQFLDALELLVAAPAREQPRTVGRRATPG